MEIREDIHVDQLTIHEVKADLGDIDPQTIIFQLPDQHSFQVSFSNVYLSLEVGAEVDFVIHTHGKIYSHGSVRSILSRVKFTPIDEHNPYPFIVVEIVDIQLDTNSWDIHVDFDFIPSWMIDWIINLFKSKILDDIVPRMSEAFKNVFQVKVNQMIPQYYPLKYWIKQLGMNVDLTPEYEPTFDNNVLVFAVKGYFGLGDE